MKRSSYIDGDSLTRIPIVKNERREIYIHALLDRIVEKQA